MTTTLDRVRNLAEEGISDPDEMAAILKRSRKTVDRYRSRLGLVDPSRVQVPLSDEEVARVKALLAEGVWLTWIAEDIGRDYSKLRQRFRPGIPEDFYSVWQSIRQRPELLALHHEFAPKITKGRRE